MAGTGAGGGAGGCAGGAVFWGYILQTHWFALPEPNATDRLIDAVDPPSFAVAYTVDYRGGEK